MCWTKIKMNSFQANIHTIRRKNELTSISIVYTVVSKLTITHKHKKCTKTQIYKYSVTCESFHVILYRRKKQQTKQLTYRHIKACLIILPCERVLSQPKTYKTAHRDINNVRYVL